MSEAPIYPRLRGSRRFWNPVESRYWIYERPAIVEAECGQCGSAYLFHPQPVSPYEHDPESGGYRVLKGAVCGEIGGRGACGKCGKMVNSISWPASARIKIRVAEGLLWCWNKEQLPAVRALVAGDKVRLRRMLLNDWRLSRIIGRIPTFATLKRNRVKVLKAIDQYLSHV